MRLQAERDARLAAFESAAAELLAAKTKWHHSQAINKLRALLEPQP